MIYPKPFLLLTFLVLVDSIYSPEDLTSEFTKIFTCELNRNIFLWYKNAQTSADQSRFSLFINKRLQKDTAIKIVYSSPGSATTTGGIVYSTSRTYETNVRLAETRANVDIDLNFEGKESPQIKSVLIDNVESCIKHSDETTERFSSTKLPLSSHTNQGQQIYKGDEDNRSPTLPKPVSLSRPHEEECGVRKVTRVQLIIGGTDTKLGDWPWHVAIYKILDSSINYICGGTLISKSLVLTAAHCVTREGVPVLGDSLSVVLGKYHLFGGEETPQDRRVYEIIVHPDYEPILSENDIALLKLNSQAVYNDYVQPACLWESGLHSKLPSKKIQGTVAGWGLDENYVLSKSLRQVVLPRVSQVTCIKSHPTFFAKAVNDHNFCAGLRNGSSACNGDSGGGYHVFVPDTPGDNSHDAPGKWYVQGITSQAVSETDHARCDPKHYIIFTDVETFIDWIREYM